MNITTEFIANGFIIHNDTQISVEVDKQVILYTVENTQDFVNIELEKLWEKMNN